MEVDLDIEALESIIADKKALLADLEAGKIPGGLGRPFEEREAGLRRQILELEATRDRALKAAQ